MSPELRVLEQLEFEGKGEDFVGSRFITPLLTHLGYETHGDYEVIRAGDDASRFKVQYPVKSGAQKVKHYNPDYLPTIRKKMFWVIEAKSGKVKYPFLKKYVVQGAQYCVHPEIQAKYLLLTNGSNSSVYDVQAAAFSNADLYQPFLEFATSELTTKWPEIFALLSVEKMRERIEDSVKQQYDKLCVSSLDKDYPRRLLGKLGTDTHRHSQHIEKHVYSLIKAREDREAKNWWKVTKSLTADQLYEEMEGPMGAGGRVVGRWFVEQSLSDGVPEAKVFDKLTGGYDGHSIFRKLQSYAGLCHLHFRAREASVKTLCFEFLEREAKAGLPLLNQVECASLRAASKYFTAMQYAPLRKTLDQMLATAPEIVRFVYTPTVLALTESSILMQHRNIFEKLKIMDRDELEATLKAALEFEQLIEEQYKESYARLPPHEKPLLGGFANYGVNGRHYQFRGLFIECGISASRDGPLAQTVSKTSDSY